MSQAPEAAWLLLGMVSLINGTLELGPDEPVILVQIAPVEACWPSNTIVLDWASLGQVELLACSTSRGLLASASGFGDRLFFEMLPGPVIDDLLAAAGRPTASSLVPIAYLSGRRQPGTDVWLLHAYGQIRFLDRDACFIRLTDQAIETADVASLSFLPAVLALHAGNALFLNNHQCYYRKLFGGDELEHKYTFDGAIDIWRLTLRLYRRLRSGDLPGFLMEYHDEFQAWDYVNHLFEIPAPPAEQGYVSFIPTTDGRHTIKRKWYRQDAFRRREEMSKGVTIKTSFAEYVADVLRLEAVPLPPFRRVRYDVNFESVRTGHVYGIFFDQSSILTEPDRRLYQCELEYLRTRAVVPVTEGDVLEEIEQIAGWLEGFLDEEGLPTRRGVYSKLSFLQDVVASRDGGG